MADSYHDRVIKDINDELSKKISEMETSLAKKFKTLSNALDTTLNGYGSKVVGDNASIRSLEDELSELNKKIEVMLKKDRVTF